MRHKKISYNEITKKRNHYSAELKTKVVHEFLSEASTVSELAAKYDISPVMITRWKQEFLERTSDVFKKGTSDIEKELVEKEVHISDLNDKLAN